MDARRDRDETQRERTRDESPERTRSELVDELIIDVVDEMPRRGFEQPTGESLSIPMKVGADAPDGVVDMTKFKPLSEHVARELNLKSVAFQLNALFQPLPTATTSAPVKVEVKNDTSLYVLRNKLARLPRDALEEGVFQLTVTPKTVLPCAKPEAAPRSSKQTASDKLPGELFDLVYGAANRGKHRVQGKWTEAASLWMFEHPQQMRDHLRISDACLRALGSRCYAVSPLSYGCPFECSVKCK